MMFECIDKIYPSVYFPTVTGDICSFNSQYAGLPLKSHSVEIVATQSGSGTPSPSNPRPITGYSAINISHSDADTSNPTVYTIQIGSTVYGGEYDARTGVLVSKYARIKISDMIWNIGDDFFFSSLPLKKKGTTNILCECLRVVDVPSVLEMVNGDIKGHQANTNMYIKNTDWASTTDLYNAIGDYYIVYELATPTTIQLPSCPIDTLEGVNNIFADCGDTTVEYIKIV